MSPELLLSLLAVPAAVVALVMAGAGLRPQPRQTAQVWFAIGLVLLAVETLIGGLGGIASEMEAVRRWEIARSGVKALALAPWVLFSLSYSRGDQGGKASRRWKLWVGASLFLAGLVGAFPAAVIAPLDSSSPSFQVGFLGFVVSLASLSAAIAVMTNLEKTYRHAMGVMRWRIKYIVLGVGLLFGFRLFASSQTLLHGVGNPLLQQLQAPVLLLACGLIAVALRRTQAFAVDVYPSHAFLYRSLTLLLAGIYLVVVGLLGRLVSWLGGDAAVPLKILFGLVALTLLAVGGMSNRVRQWLKQFVSHHLRRPAYDYRKVWATFTARTTSLVDDAAYSRAVVMWVSETFEVLSASLWLLDESRERLRFGSSTSLVNVAARELEEDSGDLRELLPDLVRQRDPINLDHAKGREVDFLRKLHPGILADGGDRTCLCLAVGKELLGVLLVGDRVGGLELSQEDHELLRYVGDQVAAGLLNLQLSRRLVRAKEMEAFQTMSAFFVHDLKNTASSLSLMFQNLEEHFADPEFRADAIRAVGKSVQHLNDLIGRLGMLRQELKLQPVDSDLAVVVEQALAETGRPGHVTLEKNLRPVTPVRLDPGQIHKVVQNLILNAQDAVASGGHVQIHTRAEKDWAVLTVVDDGCGMSPDFLRKSLFRPFQTTKKRGLGIGMFQSKLIVEAHQGRVEVESTLGQGTTVRVLLPLAHRI